MAAARSVSSSWPSTWSPLSSMAAIPRLIAYRITVFIAISMGHAAHGPVFFAADTRRRASIAFLPITSNECDPSLWVTIT